MSLFYSAGLGRDAIPDSVVSRPADNTSGSTSDKNGVQIETDVEWKKIGGRVSGNVSGVTRAYIYRISDATLMGEADISGISAGETFTIDLTNNLVSGEDYNFVLDAEGSSYAQAWYDSPSFPYSSSDGDLRIINGANGETGINIVPVNIDELGNVGF